jgi:hypothetical protein
MSLAVRRVSLINDRQEMLDILERHFGSSQEERFDWRHTLNPAGESWAWFVYERDTNATVAMAAVFPRQLYIDGKLLVCGQVGEFAVEATHRSLGPAVLMQRTTFEPVNSGALAVCYDCPPHDQGMSTFVRLGMPANCEVTRYALPLRSDEFLEKRLGKGVWTQLLVRPANMVLRMRRTRRHASGLEIRKYDGRFSEEFSRLDRLVSTTGVVRACRSAEYLNWRFKDDPSGTTQMPCGNMGGYRLLEARRAGELVAFAIFFIQTDGVASVIDLFGVDLHQNGSSLLEAVIEVCRKENVSSVHGFSSESNELSALFRNAGFSARERLARVVAYEKPNGHRSRLLSPGLHWAFSQNEIML